jgi:benzylsuccinate CoA-transferase BbsE subunit
MNDSPLPLSASRCLDLTTEPAHFCGKILADLGCDVIKVEPPGGDPGRARPPFYKDVPGPNRSLFWLSYNTGKRSVTLRLESAEGQNLFRRLAVTADFLVESFPPGTMERLGLGYRDLAAINPRLIMASISGFGQHGPYRDYQSPELIAQAIGGLLFLSGGAEHPPARLGVPIAWLMAAAQAVVAMLLAYRRRTTDENGGQYIDLSVQEAVTNLLYRAPIAWALNGEIDARGTLSQTSHRRVRSTWPCKDGYVTWTWWVGPGWGRKNRPLFEWMAELGAADDLLDYDYEAMSPQSVPAEFAEHVERVVASFFRRFTKTELYEEAVRRRIMLFPINTPQDITEDVQLQQRGFWVRLRHPDLDDELIYPGPYFRSTAYTIGPRRSAPGVGEHNEAVFGTELGLTAAQIRALREAGVI